MSSVWHTHTLMAAPSESGGHHQQHIRGCWISHKQYVHLTLKVFHGMKILTSQAHRCAFFCAASLVDICAAVMAKGIAPRQMLSSCALARCVGATSPPTTTPTCNTHRLALPFLQPACCGSGGGRLESAPRCDRAASMLDCVRRGTAMHHWVTLPT